MQLKKKRSNVNVFGESESDATNFMSDSWKKPLTIYLKPIIQPFSQVYYSYLVR